MEKKTLLPFTLFENKRFWRIDGSNTAAYLLPIRLTLIYLGLSVLIYAFGPFDWTTYKPVLFYTLLVLYMAGLWFGYRLGLLHTAPNALEWKKEHIDKAIFVLSVLIVVNYIVYVLNLFRSYGLSSLDFPELFKQMAIGIKNPGLGYRLNLQRLESLQGSDVLGGFAFSVFNYLWAFFRYPILIFSMLYFRRLKVFGKVFAVLYLATMVLFYLSIGTNIDILHVFLLIELGPVLNTFSSWHKGTLTKKKVFRLLACILAGIVLIACYFTWMMVSRGGIEDYDKPGYNVSDVELKDDFLGDASESDSNSWVPPIVMKFWISFSSYFSQGYYGMSQALNLPWTPMFGIGNSMFLVDFLSEHIHNIDQYTYQVKVENAYGWESDMRWHSIYTWIANDVSFYGVILVMILIGILFAMMFKDAITTHNPIAKASVFYFILMVLFIPCNNQLGQRYDTLLSFLFLVVCWFLTKYPPKWIRKLFVD